MSVDAHKKSRVVVTFSEKTGRGHFLDFTSLVVTVVDGEKWMIPEVVGSFW